MINIKDYQKSTLVYRFRSSVDYNLDAFLKNEMYGVTPNILNDPLDCPITYNLEILYKRLIKRKAFAQLYFNKVFIKSVKKKGFDSFETYESYEKYQNSIFEECMLKLLDPLNASIIKEFIRSLSKTILFEVRECFAIVSFSLTIGNAVMWSHYASNYRGFVLAYDLEELYKIVNLSIENDYFLKRFNDIAGLYKVKYLEIGEMIDGTELMYELICKKMAKKYEYSDMMEFLMTSKYKGTLLTLLTTKDKSWEYEDEIRLIFPREDAWHSLNRIEGKQNEQICKVSNCYLPNKVIIGANMSNVTKAAIGFYCLNNPRVILQKINIDRLMSDRCLYLTLIKPIELIK